MYVTSIEKTPEKKTPSGASVRWLLARENGAPGFEMRYFEIQPGAGTTGKPHPFEHQVFVVRGSGTIEGDAETVSIEPEDAVLILPGERHRISNSGTGILGFVCVIPSGAEDELK